MTFRLIAMLAWILALPGLAIAQSPATQSPATQSLATQSPAITAHRPPTRQSAPITAGRTQAAGPVLIDVNSADEKTLDSLPGVGPVRAKAIVANRPYTEKQDLVTKKAVPANVLAQIDDKIALINVNTATAAFMAKVLPNVGPVRAQQIVDKRPYTAAQDMVTKGALTQGVFDGLKNLVTTGS